MNSLAISIVVLLGLAVVGWLAYGKGAQRGHHLASEMRSLREQVALHKRRKDEAYRERNTLAALLAAVLQDEGIAAPRGVHEADSWRIYRGYDPHFGHWAHCLYLEPPPKYGIGQLCWHFPEEQAWMIDVLGAEEHPAGWDKRSMEEKNEAVEAFLAGVREAERFKES